MVARMFKSKAFNCLSGIGAVWGDFCWLALRLMYEFRHALGSTDGFVLQGMKWRAVSVPRVGREKQ